MALNSFDFPARRYYGAPTQMPSVGKWLSGEAVFSALKKAVEELKSAAPKDHDILIQAFDIAVLEVRYIEPHTLLLSGFNQEGNHTAVVAHFSQLVAHVVYLPRRDPTKDRVVTGFWREEEPGEPATTGNAGESSPPSAESGARRS